MGKETKNIKICKLGVWDSTIPGIHFDKNGISNYAKLQKKLMMDFPRGEVGQKKWDNIVAQIKKKGKKNKYNCIIGVSGGTDSSYLLHISKKYGLKPLAVNLDNGFNSNIAVSNIKRLTSKLDIDLETYVINYEEVKDLLKVYMKACLPWIDNPTDQAIDASLYKIANRENIKYILVGTDFRSEGKQPSEWTYSDYKQLKYLHKLYGSVQLKNYPLISYQSTLYNRYINGITKILPFNYIDYNKTKAQKYLQEKYDWDYYGGHHHENIFTKWAISYWMPEKFNIDKRKITLSAQILSREITKEKALSIINKPSYNTSKINSDTEYIVKKLELTDAEYDEIWHKPNKSFHDYPSNFKLINKYSAYIIPLISKITKSKPKFFYEQEARK